MFTLTSEGDQTRERLLGCARDLYLQGGLSAVSVREVARRAGVSPGALYRHFDGREALLREVCASGFRVFGSYLMRALEGRTPRERMVQCAEQYLAFGVERPADYRVIFMGASEGHGELMPKGMPRNAPTFVFLVDRVKECQAAHVVAKGDPIELAAMIWSMVHGMVSLRLTGQFHGMGGDAPFRRFFLHAFDRLLAGIAP